MAQQSAVYMAMPDPPGKLTFLRSNKNLCESCKGINYESLTTPGGYKHSMTIGELIDESFLTSCDLCMLLKEMSYQTSLNIVGGKRIILSITKDYWGSYLGVSPEGADLTEDLFGSHVITTMNGACVTDLKSTTNSVNNTSEVSLQVIDRWFRSCLKDHKHCSVDLFPLASSSNNVGILSPKRLIDLKAFHGTSENARLIETNSETSEYAALSYCWGETAKYTYQTTDATLPARLSCIKYSELPLTIQQAFQTARYLKIRYLWIDSLCIIQGSKSDWEEESSKMGTIYSQAKVTLAADWGESVNSGCFNPVLYKRTILDHHLEIEIISHLASGEESCLVFSVQNRALSDVERGKLSSRAWAFQERVLSSRIVHFARSQIFWECREISHAEDGLERPHLQPRLYPSFALSLRYEPENGLMLWYNFVIRETMARRLTVPSDKLPAISAVAAYWSGFVNSTYLAGIWQKDLHYGLAWYLPSGPGVRPLEYRSPSWSWASLDADSIIWAVDLSATAKIQIDETSVTLESEDRFGRVTAGFIKVTGRLQKFSMTAKHELTCASDKLNLTGKDIATHLDVENLTLSEVWGLLLSRCHTYCSVLLLSTATADPELYQREGLADMAISQLEEDILFDVSCEQTITII